MVQAREFAHRVFIAELSKVNVTFKESDDKFAPNYALLPSGVKANRVLIIGTLMEVEHVGDANAERFRFKLADPTGSMIMSASRQYQPNAYNSLSDLEAPAYVALVGKPYTYESEDKKKTYVGVRPESVIAVDADTANMWINEALVATVERLEKLKTPDVMGNKAIEHYGNLTKDFKDIIYPALKEAEEWEKAASATGDLKIEVEPAAPAKPAAEAPKAEKAPAPKKQQKGKPAA